MGKSKNINKSKSGSIMNNKKIPVAMQMVKIGWYDAEDEWVFVLETPRKNDMFFEFLREKTTPKKGKQIVKLDAEIEQIVKFGSVVNVFKRAMSGK